MTVGKDPHGNNEYFNGAIDEVRIYKRALLPQEIGVLTGTNRISSKTDKFNIFPNPTSSVLNIHFHEIMPKSTSLEIINMLGETVFESSLTGQINTLDVTRINRGIYFIKIENQSEAYVQKFVKE